MEYFSIVMELFRTHPSLCSLFLTTLEEWGAENIDWSLLGDEDFVDVFLRNLCATDNVEKDALLQAFSALLQPSPGGLLAAACLHREGYLEDDDFADFVDFSLRGSGNGWKPLSWANLIELLEEVAFSEHTHESGLELGQSHVSSLGEARPSNEVLSPCVADEQAEYRPEEDLFPLALRAAPMGRFAQGPEFLSR